MEILKHLIYEYKKGIRHLLLFTLPLKQSEEALGIVKKHSIAHLVTDCGDNRNIFFGNKECVDVVKNFSSTNLAKLTPQEDFILGTLLGYDPVQQSNRYLKKLNYSCSR